MIAESIRVFLFNITLYKYFSHIIGRHLTEHAPGSSVLRKRYSRVSKRGPFVFDDTRAVVVLEDFQWSYVPTAGHGGVVG
jgi:hypothetical protein